MTVSVPEVVGMRWPLTRSSGVSWAVTGTKEGASVVVA